MSNFDYDPKLSDAENILAKRKLRHYYRWRFGELPPRDWQADHQVEQNSRSYRRFSGKYIHSLGNLIYVPPDINGGKNHWYARPWATVPKCYRPFAGVVDTKGKSATELGQDEQSGALLSVRFVLHLATQFHDDDFAFVTFTQFSRSMLLRLIRIKLRTTWKTSPPQWLVETPHWLERLKDEVENHMQYVADYHRAHPHLTTHHEPEATASAGANTPARTSYTQAQLARIWEEWPSTTTD